MKNVSVLEDQGLTLLPSLCRLLSLLHTRTESRTEDWTPPHQRNEAMMKVIIFMNMMDGRRGLLLS